MAGFDTHEIVKRLKAAGFHEEQAEAVTGVVRDSRDIDIANLGTKADLAHVEKTIEKAIAEVKVDLLKWVIGLMLAQTGLIFAMLRATR